MNDTKILQDTKKTIVAMSGGVDSSVAAAILKREGHDVLGVTFDFFEDVGGAKKNLAIDYAKRVSGVLGIPHKTVKIHEAFNKKVVMYFLEEYLKGRTPIPCSVCNKLIKFNQLMSLAENEGCQFVATGHYARIAESDGKYLLKKGIDSKRDQTFFLSRLGQDELKRVIFPLGELEKDKVKEIVADLKLPTITEESREICFIPEKDNNVKGDYRKFIERVATENHMNLEGSGEIVDTSGKVLGEHKGYFNFTIGQRKGIGIPSKEPYYVISIDAEKKRVVVGGRENLFKDSVSAIDFSWVSGCRPDESEMRVMGMIRYKQSPSLGTAMIDGDDGNKVTIVFDEPQFAPAPGQTLVLFDDDTLLGGGFIL